MVVEVLLYSVRDTEVTAADLRCLSMADTVEPFSNLPEINAHD